MRRSLANVPLVELLSTRVNPVGDITILAWSVLMKPSFSTMCAFDVVPIRVSPYCSLKVWNCFSPWIGTIQPTTGRPSPLEMFTIIVLFALGGADATGGGAATGAATITGAGAGAGFFLPRDATMMPSNSTPPGITIHSHQLLLGADWPHLGASTRSVGTASPWLLRLSIGSPSPSLSVSECSLPSHLKPALRLVLASMIWPGNTSENRLLISVTAWVIAIFSASWSLALATRPPERMSSLVLDALMVLASSGMKSVVASR